MKKFDETKEIEDCWGEKLSAIMIIVAIVAMVYFSTVGLITTLRWIF
jgi:hypothetical protein